MELRYVDAAPIGSGGVMDAVYRLWKLHSVTLGFWPFEAFLDRARSRQLLAAVDTESQAVAGYVLFDLPRTGQIKLQHVCVAEAARGTGLARRMTDRIVADHPERLELAADCREDYDLHPFWSKLGMSPRAERPGRRQMGSVLIRWRRPLGQPDLLEAALLASNLPLAVLDSNVVTDLCSAPHVHRERAQESTGLLAAWMTSQLDYAVSGQMDLEISRTSDVLQRAALRSGSQHWVRLRTTRPDDTALEDALSSRLAAALHRDTSLGEDLLHLADAIRANAAYFVTNDDNLITSTEDWLLAEYDIEAIRPHVLVGRTRSRIGQPSFIPRLIDSVDLDWVPADRFSNSTLQNTFTDHRSSERGRHLLRRLAGELSHPDRTRVQVLANRHAPWALLAYRQEGNELQVPLLRVAAGAQGRTVALQLTRYLRRRAVEAGCSVIAVTDAVLPLPVSAALREDGYAADGDRWTAHPKAGVEFRDDLSADEAADRERLHYPLAVAGINAATAIVPIRPRYAESLIGYGGDTLLQLRRTALGILRQHVYFHAPSGPKLPIPTRLLWYVTADDWTETRRIVARSRLISSDVLPAEEAHAVYRELGVLSLSRIREVANKSGEVHVIRFEDTELLDRPLDRTDLRVLNAAHGIRGNFQSIRNVPNVYFDDIMKMQPMEKP